MTSGYPIESILAADCGSVHTRVVLLDVIDGQYRFVAKGEALSTVEPPHSDITLAVRHAIEQIEETTGRLFLDEQGQLLMPEQSSGHGVDAFVATSSAGAPLRLVLVGLSQELSLSSARRAASFTYVAIEDVISLDNSLGERRNVEDKIGLIQRHRPDLILVAGGTDGGTTSPIIEMARVVAMACSILKEDKPQEGQPRIIFAGNAEVRADVAEIIGSEAELRVVDNVRPTLHLENLTQASEEIEACYRECKMEAMPGFDTLSSWSPVPVLPTARAWGYVVQYLARQWESGKGVIGIDIGGTTTTIAAMLEDRFSLHTRSDLGMGPNIDRILSAVELDDILRWLPFEMEATEAHNIILNKHLRPTTVPQTREELLLEQAVAREILRLALDEARTHWRAGPSRPYPGLAPFFEPIIGGGGVLTNAPHHGQTALILLDALQPIGVSTIVLDATALAAPLGALATFQPLAAAQVLERDAFLNLGTVVAPIGTAREGDIVLKLKIDYGGGMALDVEVAYGSLEVIPLPLGQTAVLHLKPLRGFDVGWGTKGVPLQVNGGTLGIIIDARGRPLPLPTDSEARRTKMQQWLWDMGSA